MYKKVTRKKTYHESSLKVRFNCLRKKNIRESSAADQPIYIIQYTRICPKDGLIS